MVGAADGVPARNPSSVSLSTRFIESSYDNTLKANQPLFSTWPGVTNRSLYDWESSISARSISLMTTTASAPRNSSRSFLRASATCWRRRIGWLREDAKRYNRNLFGSAPGAGIGKSPPDRCQRAPARWHAQPVFLRPFLGIAEPVSIPTPTKPRLIVVSSPTSSISP